MRKLFCVKEGLELLKRNWMLSKFKKYKLDPEQGYLFNPTNGKIKKADEHRSN